MKNLIFSDTIEAETEILEAIKEQDAEYNQFFRRWLEAGVDFDEIPDKITWLWYHKK